MRLRTVDAYLLRLMAKPMMAALAVTLAALLLERVLRLFELLTGKGAPLGLVLAMTLNLVPHYLGLALPAAFAVGIIAVMTSLGSENELDAMEGAGWSIRRIGAIFIFCGAILGVLSLLLFGYLQPYSRYAYQAVKHELVNAAWDARVEAGTFIDAGEGMTISAEEVDPTGRILDRVFVLQKQEGDAERILTAERGVLIPNVETRTLRLRLVNGVAVSIGRTEGELSVSFDSLTLEREFDLDGELFRPRGGSERELTQKELLARIRGDEGAPRPTLRGGVSRSPDPGFCASRSAVDRGAARGRGETLTGLATNRTGDGGADRVSERHQDGRGHGRERDRRPGARALGALRRLFRLRTMALLHHREPGYGQCAQEVLRLDRSRNPPCNRRT